MLSNLISKFKKSKIAGDSVKYTFLNFLEKAIPFLILPIITRVLPKEEVGYYMLYQAFIEIAIPIIGLNISTFTLLNYYKLDKHEFKIYFSNGLVLFGICALFFLLLLISTKDFIAVQILFPSDWLLVIFFIASFQILTNMRLNLWRVNYKIKEFGYLTISG